ncbi:hypothetical protein QCB45_00025 [Thiomicrorhabdus sp. ZW0627]|uniref:hypothetical protein n=1 Tax=Thiomicrorhabdus sp. ZW0627 TaxID=3039774 RepID=UPI002436FE89|nr:hypothetical protein [Thiomicrorhabdus sp. ZW0627]MDG6772715.1 hypothetical protein [Thiomicrorhabdus sp. ZW0627]
METPASANSTPTTNESENTTKELLKQATSLKKENKYDLACEKLQEAYQAEGAENLTIKERLRLPMYLQLAERNEEGWKELNRLTLKYIDVFSQVEIANQMRIFLQNEKKYMEAVEFAIWTLCKEIERDRFNLEPNESLNTENMTPESIEPRIAALLKKAKKPHLAEIISKQVSDYLHSTQHYDPRAIRDLLRNDGIDVI